MAPMDRSVLWRAAASQVLAVTVRWGVARGAGGVGGGPASPGRGGGAGGAALRRSAAPRGGGAAGTGGGRGVFAADTGDLERLRELPGEVAEGVGPVEILVA